MESPNPKLPLEMLYHWEKTTPDRVYLRQPYAGKGYGELTFAQVADQVRRVADWVTVLDRSLITEGPPAETLALDRVLALIPSAGEGRARR